MLALYEDRQSWALYCRQELPTRGNNTNNMVESAFHVLKDKVFARTCAYSVPQLFGFVTDSVDEYFGSKLLTAVSGKTGGQRSRYIPSSMKATDKLIISDGGMSGLYSVFNPSSGQTYSTHLAVGICSCPVGITGGPCMHQHAVSVKYNLEGHNTVLLSAETKRNFHWVANSSHQVPDDWYRSLSYSSPQKATPISDGNIQPSTAAVSTGMPSTFTCVSVFICVWGVFACVVITRRYH